MRDQVRIDDRRGTWFGLRRRTYDARRGARVNAAIGTRRALVPHATGRGEGACPEMGISNGEASQTAAALPGLLRYWLVSDAGLEDLGLHRMNGMGRPERIFQSLAGQRPPAAVAG